MKWAVYFESDTKNDVIRSKNLLLNFQRVQNVSVKFDSRIDSGQLHLSNRSIQLPLHLIWNQTHMSSIPPVIWLIATQIGRYYAYVVYYGSVNPGVSVCACDVELIKDDYVNSWID